MELARISSENGPEGPVKNGNVEAFRTQPSSWNAGDGQVEKYRA